MAITLTLSLTAWAVTAVSLPAELEPYFASIRQVESRGHPWSIYDNTARRSYRLNSRAEAETKAKELIAYGHNLDLGMMQLNCRYQCKRPGVSVDNIFDPEVNVNTAKIIFLEFWEQARKVSTEFLTRIVAAVGAYNNGRVFLPNPGYVSKVWREMGKPTTNLPVEGSGTPSSAVATAGGSRPSLMDNTMARFNSGAQWTRDRMAAISGTEGARTDPNLDPEGQKSKRRQANHYMAAGVGVGVVAAAVLTGGLIFLLIKAVGLYKAFKLLQLMSSMTKRKQE